jgi:hypothetical protein
VDQQWRQTKAEEALYASRSSSGANRGNREGGGNEGRLNQQTGSRNRSAPRGWFGRNPASWAPRSNPPAYVPKPAPQQSTSQVVPMDVD